jgi:hypothetical protein
MALTHAEKTRIAAAYAPILIFHPEEPFVPIRPEHYLGAAALWRSQPPSDQKKDWGEGGPGFPRRPLIPKGGISVNPAQDVEGASDPDGDGVNEWYLGHRNALGIHPYLISHEGTELFLDSSAWRDADDVTDTSVNVQCAKDKAIAKWQEMPGQFTRTFSDWHCAVVLEPTDIERLLLTIGESNGKPIGNIVRELLGEIWIVVYYFLYPIHEEYLRRCEQVFEDGDRRGDYEGDWNAVAVVVRKPAVLPWDPGGSFEQPTHVGYGVRLRGLGKDFQPDLFKQGMIVRSWNQTPKMGNHARVYVAKGYHNNYSEPGDHDPAGAELLGIPLPQIVCELTEEVDEKVNDVKETLEDIGEVAKDVTITIAKVAAGGAIGGSLFGPLGAMAGAIGGAIAGVIEAVSSSNTDDVPSEEIRKELEREPGPPDKRYGLVLTPADVGDPLIHDADPAKNETAAAVRVWNGKPEERVIDRNTQIWWPGETGFNGRWGVRVENDPNNRRSGIQVPDFRRALLNDLGIHLAKTT